MGIISVLIFLLLGGLFGSGHHHTEVREAEPGFDDPIAEEYFSRYTTDSGYCDHEGRQSAWACVDKKLRTFDSVILLELNNEREEMRFTTFHYVIRPDGSVTLYTETWADGATEWSRTECATQATIRETVQSC